VSNIGLPATISNQILRKYGNNKNIKEINSVNLTIPYNNGKGIRIEPNNIVYVPCIKKRMISWYDLSNVRKINQIEVSKEYYHVTFEVNELPTSNTDEWMGIDLNTTEHMAVIAVGNKILKRNKKAAHIKKKFHQLRKKLQNLKKYRLIKNIKNKESRIIKDTNHKLSREIVDIAKANNIGIRMENLTSIRDRTKKKSNKTTRRLVNNWNFYQLRLMVEYKARIFGVPVEFINPAYTSQACSKCKCIGIRNSKSFKCPTCGHVDHADANAAFNIKDGEVLVCITQVSKAPNLMVAVNLPIQKLLENNISNNQMESALFLTLQEFA
jgi:putative transposase